MGDRGHIVMKYESGEKIYFYTHSDGYRLKEILYNALKRRLRWDDDAYLARIIFCEMIKDRVDGELGYGIAPHEMDNEYPLLIVDTGRKTILYDENSWSFEEFLAAFENPTDNVGVGEEE